MFLFLIVVTIVTNIIIVIIFNIIITIIIIIEHVYMFVMMLQACDIEFSLTIRVDNITSSWWLLSAALFILQ